VVTGAWIGKAAGEHGMLSCLTSVQPSHPNDPAIDSAHAATADRAATPDKEALPRPNNYFQEQS